MAYQRSSEGMVVGGHDALEFEGDFFGVSFEGIEGGFADDGHIRGGVVLSQSRFVLAEGDVHRPVQGVFDAPMGADGLE